MDKTNELMRVWIAAKARVKSARAELNSAECAELNAAHALGKWLVPDDTNQPGVPFHVWVGSGVLSAEKGLSGDFRVYWYKEPDGKDRAEFGC